MSSESKEKLRQSHLGKKLSPEHIEKLKQSRLGRKMSPETIAKRTETRKKNRLLKLAQMEGQSKNHV